MKKNFSKTRAQQVIRKIIKERATWVDLEDFFGIKKDRLQAEIKEYFENKVDSERKVNLVNKRAEKNLTYKERLNKF